MTNKVEEEIDNIINKGFYKERDMIEKLFEIHSSAPFKILKNGEKLFYHANIFLHGDCHIFAYVLHKEFGYDILEIQNESGTTLHWCCLSKYNEKKVYIDVRGITTNFEKILAAFQPNIGNKPLKRIVTNLEDYNYEWDQEDKIKFAKEVIEKYYNYYMI